MAEIEADPQSLHGLLKLKKGISTTTCSFCRKRTSPPHNYLNCPERPCYLCFRHGHQQVSCPYRLSPGAAEAALKALLAGRDAKSRPLRYTQAYQLGEVSPAHLVMRSPQCSMKVVAAVSRAHVKRVTCLEYIPSNPCTRVISTDKRGIFVTWNFGMETANGKYALDTQRAHLHRCNVNTLQFQGDHTMYSSSSDGTVAKSDLNVFGAPAASDKILDLNPDGFISCKTFRMAYGMCLSQGFGATCSAYLVVGDDVGMLHQIDPRTDKPTASIQAHKTKIQHADGNVSHGALFCTASNDKTVKLWDARKLDSGLPLVTLPTKAGVSAAMFSRRTGTKLLVTTLDNKIYIWKDIHALGNANDPPAATLEVTHSHQFNRYLTNSKAVWDPKDWREDLFLCGRYLAEAYNVRGKPCLLHPIDLFSASSGKAVASLVDGALGTVCSINRFHPAENIIVTGSSQNLYMWGVPLDPGDHVSRKSERDGVRPSRSNHPDDDGNDDDDNNDLSPAERKRRISQVQTSVRPRARRRTQQM